MQKTVKELVKQNNDKRKDLTPENREYYENLLVYTRTNALKSERATEEVLLEMLDHLLEAQKEGKGVEEVFGKSPKELAQEIVATLPKESFKSTIDFVLEIAFTFIGWYLVVVGIIPLISQKDQTIHLGSLALSGILMIASLVTLLFFVFSMIRRNAFKDKKGKNKATLLLGILFALFLVGAISSNYAFEPFGPTMTISYLLEFGLGCFLLLAAYLIKKLRDSK